jgi:phosphoketolase
MASWEKVKSWDLSDSCVLHNASKEIQDLDIDAIFNKDRNKIQSLVLMSSIINNGFYQLNKTDEIWYGSFRSESTFTAPNDAIRNLQTNFVESALNRVMKGKWQAPMTTEQLISSWENFKL